MTKVRVVAVAGNMTDLTRSAIARSIAEGFANCGAGVAEHKEVCALCKENAVEDAENMNICSKCFSNLKL
jgi:hypothetical protein